MVALRLDPSLELVVPMLEERSVGAKWSTAASVGLRVRIGLPQAAVVVGDLAIESARGTHEHAGFVEEVQALATREAAPAAAPPVAHLVHAAGPASLHERFGIRAVVGIGPHLPLDTVEAEVVVRGPVPLAEAEARPLGIDHLSIDDGIGDDPVEMRIVRPPEARVVPCLRPFDGLCLARAELDALRSESALGVPS